MTSKNTKAYYWTIAIWIAFFAIALLWLMRPEKEIVVTPDGWKKWSKTGALYTLIPYKKGILAGGTKGLWYSDGNTTLPFAAYALPKGATVYFLVKQKNRGLWIGHSEGLTIFHDGKWKNLNSTNGLPKPPIHSVVLDQKGGWVAGENSLIRFSGTIPTKDSNKTRILPNQNFSVHRISVLLLDHYANLWVGTSEAPRGGLFIVSEKNIKLFSVDDGLPHPQVTSIMKDHRGRIWAGTGFYNQGGAAIFVHTKHGWKLQKTLLGKELAGPKVRSLAQDKQGFYWIGSERNGIAIRNEKKTITVLHKEQGLPGEEVTQTLQTADGSIWLATLKGLVHIDTNVVSTLQSAK